MMAATDPRPNLSTSAPTVLTEGFRFFFLSAALFAVVSIAAWLAWMAIHAASGMVTRPSFAGAPHLWHGHEMIFGYAAAVIAGFFLTAVPSWTGTAPARALFVAGVGGLWLLGRLAVWFSAHLDPFLVAAVDLLFLPLLTVKLVGNLLRRPKPQNLALLSLLALIFAGNVMVHLQWTGLAKDTALDGLRLGLLAVAALIAVVGGRVVPAFTRNALLRDGEEEALPRQVPWANRLGILCAVGFALAMGFGAPDWLSGVLAALAALFNGIRLAGWRSARTFHAPILWSLHLAFLMLVLGYAGYAVTLLTGALGEVGALHLLGIGAVGGMTLAIMSRAALGHTGRPLAVATPIALAYLLIAAAALLRAFGLEAAPGDYYAIMFLSGGLWCAAFLLFLVVYWPILTRPAVK